MKVLKDGCNVNTCFMCKLCSKEWLPAIAAHRKNFKVNKGETIFREGELVNGIYFVYSGLFKIHKRWETEKELIVRFAREGDIIGHRGLGKDNFFPVTATALENSTVCFVDLSFFLSTLKVNTDFLFQLMLFYAAELKDSESNMRNLAHMPVKGRIAQALIALYEKFGNSSEGSIDININRQDLASYVGTTYETLFRMMNELIAEQVIRMDEKKIFILDIKQLKQAIQ